MPFRYLFRLSSWMFLLVAAPTAWSQQSDIDAAFNELERQAIAGDGNYFAFIGGAGTAYSWANTRLSFEKQQRLYCQPDKLVLHSMNYARIAIDEYRRNDVWYKTADSPLDMLAFALLNGLRVTFPCKS